MSAKFHRCKNIADNECGIMYLCHGYADHIDRYHHFKDYLSEHGISFYAHDQRGHGQTTEGLRVHIETFDTFIDDTIKEIEAIKKEKPDIPVIISGHSMGGLVAMRLALKRPDLLAGAILSAPLLKLSDNISPVMRKLAWTLGAWIPKFYLPFSSLDREKLTPNTEQSDKDVADPLIWHYGCRAGFAVELFKAIADTNKEIEKLSVKTVIFHGDKDEICDVQGSREIAKRLPDMITLVELDQRYHSLLHLMPEDSQKIMDAMIDKFKELCGTSNVKQ